MLGAAGGSNLRRVDLSSNDVDDDALLAMRWGVGWERRRTPKIQEDGSKPSGQTKEGGEAVGATAA
jgi:hypothetical protein